MLGTDFDIWQRKESSILCMSEIMRITDRLESNLRCQGISRNNTSDAVTIKVKPPCRDITSVHASLKETGNGNFILFQTIVVNCGTS
jgi:hypothetical protein